MSRRADFIYEIGQLKLLPRSGWLTIGIDGESIAEHCFRTSVIGYMLGRMEKVSEKEMREILIGCMFHDLHETRVSDLHTVNKEYVSVKKENAIRDALSGLEFGDEIRSALNAKGKVGKIIKDADKLEMVAQAKEYLDLGNEYARDWIRTGSEGLKTASAKKLLREILESDSKGWIFRVKK